MGFQIGVTDRTHERCGAGCNCAAHTTKADDADTHAAESAGQRQHRWRPIAGAHVAITRAETTTCGDQQADSHVRYIFSERAECRRHMDATAACVIEIDGIAANAIHGHRLQCGQSLHQRLFDARMPACDHAANAAAVFADQSVLVVVLKVAQYVVESVELLVDRGDENGIQQQNGRLHCGLLTATDKRHIARLHGHVEHVGAEWQTRNVANAVCHIFDVHHRLGGDLPVGLQHTFGHADGQLGQRVANFDLARHDIERTAIERDAFGEAQYGVLGQDYNVAIIAETPGNAEYIDAITPALMSGTFSAYKSIPLYTAAEVVAASAIAKKVGKSYKPPKS